jgi:hypothetical protein
MVAIVNFLPSLVVFRLENQAHNTGSLDGNAQHFLVLEACAGNTAGKNTTLFCLELLQKFSIFEVDEIDFTFAESANFRLDSASFQATLLVLQHCHVLYCCMDLYCLISIKTGCHLQFRQYIPAASAEEDRQDHWKPAGAILHGSPAAQQV